MRPLLIAVLLLATACEREPTGSGALTRGVAVHAVLHAGSDTALVLITRVPPNGQRLRSSGVQGLRVQLIHGGQAVSLPEAPAGFPDCVRDATRFWGEQPLAEEGCYGARLPAPIRAGERYDLIAELPGGQTVRGTAVVPAAPIIQAPAARTRFVVLHDPSRRGDGEWTADIPVRWQRGVGAARFDVNLVVDERFQGGMRYPGRNCNVGFYPITGSRSTPRDSASFRIVDIDCLSGTDQLPWDSLSARILVTAFDTAYARYTDEVFRRGAVRLDRASAGVQGALGLFSAAATASREIRLVPGNR